jgi:hypothetical protein
VFPQLPPATLIDFAQETHRTFTRETKPASRMDIQRRLLEYRKMHHIDIMTLDLRAQDMEQKLARQRMIVEARGSQVSITSRFRQSIGCRLISIGERIRPEIAQSDPTYNA